MTGPPFFTGPAGVPIGWKQPNLQYFTDPADLSGSVNHAAADALVAAAAGVWNVPVASISVGQGGALAEHVSGANVYLSSDGLVWPADVESANAAAIPVAIVYDSDGSVTDTLLGGGASDAVACEQNAVTETVDAFDPGGYILHAIVVLNGRCTGPAPEQQLQMQYKLERAFGRVMGLAWSQANDNVFTGTPQPTSDQANHWPIMHPMEILCGPYSYQCLPNPFTLRPDDIAGLVSVYPIAQGATPAAGKQTSLAEATAANGYLLFPDNEGMSGVNVLMVREPAFNNDPEGFYDVSAVSGSSFHTAGSSPFVSPDTSALGSMGSTAANWRGYFDIAYLPMLTVGASQNEIASTEPINPLYIGAKSVGVYGAGVAAPAGSPPAPSRNLQIGAGTVLPIDFNLNGAPAACGDGADGTAAAPIAAPASGWWNGLLCGYGHAAYAAVNVKPGRSLTVEATALDANGFATTAKAMPAIGLFAPTDGVGALPSLGVAETAFNSLCTGMTTLNALPFPAASGGSGGVVRVGVADQRGEGRPDFAYQTRVFYADSVAPALVPVAGGGTLTIAGMGFRDGNEVLVNGVVAPVASWSATTIVATVPSLVAAGATAGAPLDVEVVDLGTGATSTMTGALTYDANAQVPNAMLLVSAQSASSPTGSVASVPFAVQVLASDGVTPVGGDTVVFSATAGSLQFGACSAAECSVTTDAHGVASTTVEPLAAGTVSMLATDGGMSVGASFVAGPDVVSLQVLQVPPSSVLVGQQAAEGFSVNVMTLNGHTLPGNLVTFSVAPGSTGSAALSPCNAPSCTVAANQWGGSGVNVTPTVAGAVTLVASSGAAQAQASFTAIAQTDRMNLSYAPILPAYVGQNAGSLGATLTPAGSTSPLVNVPITFSTAPGVQFSICGSNVCTCDTDYFGAASTRFVGLVPGTYTLTVSSSGLTQSVQLTVTVPQPQLTIVSAPTGNVPVGTQAVQALTAKLLDASGNPWVAAPVTLGGPLGEVSMACAPGTGSCVVYTDGNGMASTQVTPLQAGTITLEAVFSNIVVQSSFTSVGNPETFTLVAPPPATVNVGAPVSFTLQGISPSGGPAANHTVWVTTASGNFAYSNCNRGFCKYNTDANGNLTITGAAFLPGPVSIQATMDNLTAAVSFNVVQPAQSMIVESAPSGNFQVGSPIQPAFAVQVVGADGVTGVSGQNVTFSASPSSANVSIKACPMPCVVKTNATGVASTGAIQASGPGAISLAAGDNGMAQVVQFSVVAAPDAVSLAGAPASVYQGATATVPFAVRVTLADGATPAAGIPVNLSLGSGPGAASFVACNAATCALATNAAGMVSSLVMGTQAGQVTLQATAQLPTGPANVSAPLLVQANSYAVTAAAPQMYVAEGATVAETLSLTAVENGSAAAGQAAIWTGASGLEVGGGSSTTDANGNASIAATAGPLARGASAMASGCVWTAVCAQFTATGVSDAAWQIAVVSGGNQSVSGATALDPVVVQVTDGAGHPLAGATVTVGQTVRALDAACPVEGRCPAGAVLASGGSSGVSDAKGEVSVAPMVVQGVATTTSLAFSAGLQGFATAVVSSSP